jgi:threonine/homoserine efflux transporter RhtA
MFVHVRRKKGQGDVPKGKDDFVNADHQIMGGSFFLSEIPEGAEVRDVFGANLAKGASGIWEIWIAFGHVAGDRGRIAVKSTGNSVVQDDMVKLGEVMLP